MTSEEILGIFFEECAESLAAAEAGLAACKEGTQDSDTVNAIFRAVHSIKGGGGAFGFTALQAYTHTFETLLSEVRDGNLPLSDGLVALLLRALDTLTDHVTAAREGGQAPEDSGLIAEMTAAHAGGAAAPDAAVAETAVESAASADSSGVDLDFDLDSMLDSITGDFAAADPAPAAASPAWQVHLRPHEGAMGNGGEPLLLLRELEALGGECIACDVAAIPHLDALDPHQGYLGWTFLMPADVSQEAVRDIFDFIGDDCSLAFGSVETIPPPRIVAQAQPAPAPIAAPAPEPTPAIATAPKPVAKAPEAAPVPEVPQPAAATAAPPPPPPAAPAPAQSIRIDLPKLDRLIDSVGELVIA